MFNYSKTALKLAGSVFLLSLVNYAEAAKIDINLIPDPPKMGKQEIAITVKNDSGKLEKNAKVSAEAYMPMTGMVMKPSQAKVEDLGKSSFSAKVNLSMEGDWYLKITTNVRGKTQAFFYKITTGIKGLISVPGYPDENKMDKSTEHMHH